MGDARGGALAADRDSPPEFERRPIIA